MTPVDAAQQPDPGTPEVPAYADSAAHGTELPRSEVIDRRTLRTELLLVLWLSIAASALRSLLSLVEQLTRGVKLSEQTQALVGNYVPDRPWLDVLFQISRIGLALVPVFLVFHFLRRSGEGRFGIGFDLRDWKRDILRGMALAAVIGGVGLVFYLAAYNLGMSVKIAAVTADQTWWTWILLLASAAWNSVLEEVIVLAYMIHRLDQLGWKPWQTIASSALLRGAYHLYQGFGGFLGNIAMGAVFGVLFRRWGRVMPFVVAHFLIDAVAFIGYAALAGKVSWLP